MHTLEQLAAYRVEDLLREAAPERLARSAEPPGRRPRMAHFLAFALLITTLLAPALAHAQTSNDNSFDVPQGGMMGTPDPQTTASAYGDLSVFILNVAAGNDGVPRQPEAEQTFRDVFAQPVLAAYTSLSPDDQQ